MIWERPLVEVRDAIRDGSVSCTEVLDAVLHRLDEVEPTVRAWASIDVDGARATARRMDDDLVRGTATGDLLGVPVGIKDVIDTAGWPTEAGSSVLRGRIPDQDATATSRLRRAGAIILGKTTTHEFAYGQNVPPTRNPRDPACYPGGSSVGSGVAVAVGTAFAALGTDTGGSVRNPAAINGLVGYKPTNGLVSRAGVVPVSPSLDQVGPITRNVADCAVMLDSLAGHDPRDPGSIRSAASQALDAVRAQSDAPRVGVVTGLLHGGIQAPVGESVRAALDVMADAGAEVVEVDLPQLEAALSIGMTIALAESAAWHRPLLNDRSADYTPGTRVLLSAGALLPAADYVRARRARTWLRDAVRATFDHERLDVLAGPTLATAAAPLEHDTDLTRAEGGSDDLSSALRLLMVANLTGQPAVSLPCGDDGTHPIGLHFMGRPRGDERLLAIAAWYESLRSWVPPALRVGV